NIPNIEVSIMVMGRELAELGLTAGANDINSIVIEENVLKSSGLKTLRAAERFIREAGFVPKRRTMNYEFGKYPDVLPETVTAVAKWQLSRFEVVRSVWLEVAFQICHPGPGLRRDRLRLGSSPKASST